MLYCTYTYRRIVVPWSYHPSGFVKCWSSISAHSRYHTIASCCLGHLHLICTTMSSCSSTGSSLLLVCASVFTRATPETSFLNLRHVRESNRQAGQAVRQSDKETPARECSNDCVLHSNLGRLRKSLFVSLSACQNVAQPKSLLGRHEVLQPSAQPPLHLHSAPTCKPRLCLSLSLSLFLHGSWSMAVYTYRTLQLHCSLERKNPGSSRNSPPRTCLSLAAPDPSRPLVRLGTAFYSATVDCSHGFEACK